MGGRGKNEVVVVSTERRTGQQVDPARMKATVQNLGKDGHHSACQATERAMRRVTGYEKVYSRIGKSLVISEV